MIKQDTETQKNNPFVDIILPNYNKNKYLAESVNSVINQTYKNWKLFIVSIYPTTEVVTGSLLWEKLLLLALLFTIDLNRLTEQACLFAFLALDRWFLRSSQPLQSFPSASERLLDCLLDNQSSHRP